MSISFLLNLLLRNLQSLKQWIVWFITLWFQKFWRVAAWFDWKKSSLSVWININNYIYLINNIQTILNYIIYQTSHWLHFPKKLMQYTWQILASDNWRLWTHIILNLPFWKIIPFLFGHGDYTWLLLDLLFPWISSWPLGSLSAPCRSSQNMISLNYGTNN